MGGPLMPGSLNKDRVLSGFILIPVNAGYLTFFSEPAHES
jgi:hypothetical protein